MEGPYLHREDVFVTVSLFWDEPNQFDILVETQTGIYNFRETDGKKAMDVYNHPFPKIEGTKV